MKTVDIYFDARCLQDERYVGRGIGRHAKNICKRPTGYTGRVVAYCDPALPKLNNSLEYLFDEVSHTLSEVKKNSFCYVNLSPMTHKSILLSQMRQKENVCNAAVIYDFIPIDEAGYFHSSDDIENYRSLFDELPKYDVYFPISKTTEARLSDLINRQNMNINTTYVGVKECFFESAQYKKRNEHNLHSGKLTKQKYFLFVGGADNRKNAHLTIQAFLYFCSMSQNRSNRLTNGDQYKLLICGEYPDAMKEELYSILLNAEQNPEVIKFMERISDAELLSLYQGSEFTIVSSLIEGFSLPVAEAIASNSLVAVSNCAAHLELVNTWQTIFDKGNYKEAANVMHALTTMSDEEKEEIRKQQRKKINTYKENIVRDRFWSHLLSYMKDINTHPKFYINKDSKPRIAFATPWPPQQSGVANYSFSTVKELSKIAKVDIFTPEEENYLTHIDGVNIFSLKDKIDKSNYDKTYFVVGNSLLHKPIIDQLTKYGGTSILHDSRLFEYYFKILDSDPNKFSRFAKRMTSYDYSPEVITSWLHDRRKLPDLFLGDIIASSSEIIVHHPDFAQEVRDRYERCVRYIPFAVDVNLTDEDLNDSNRSNAKNRLSIEDNDICLVSFGWVDPIKGSLECIYALHELSCWGFPVKLHFVGSVDERYKDELLKHAEYLRLREQIRFFDEFVSNDLYRNYLIGCDGAIQLRKVGFGQGSGTIAECAAAGIMTVGNNNVCQSVEAPSFIKRVPDNLSTILIAENVANSLVDYSYKSRRIEERHLYCSNHSFSNYAKQLVQCI